MSFMNKINNNRTAGIQLEARLPKTQLSLQTLNVESGISDAAEVSWLFCNLTQVLYSFIKANMIRYTSI